MTQNKSICVYCGSQPGTDPDVIKAATDLGQSMANKGYRLVYGGGTKGIMGAVAKGVLDAGGSVTGIIPEFLMDKEASHDDLSELSELIVTKDMHERKHAMFEQADAFVTLPGGIGTLEEVIEVLTWAQLGRHEKPIVLGNINGFWNPLKTLLEHMTQSGFIHTTHLVKPLVIETSDAIIPAIEAAWAQNGGTGDATLIKKL